MAKLKAPLLSLGASGAIGKTMVFFGWKGINAVREYVVPTNPDTDLQKIQRDYVRKAVAMVHTAQERATNPLDLADQVGYSALAASKGKIMTWFNQVVTLWIAVKLKAKTPIVYSDITVDVTTLTAVHAGIWLNEETASKLAAGTWYLGKTKTNLVHSIGGDVFPGDAVLLPASDLSGWAVVGDKIYLQFRPDTGDACEGANSGIYHFKAT